MNSIVISLGGMSVHYLGCYGSPWLETPELSRFAVESCVFDQMFVECPDPQVTRRAWWSGCYQLSRHRTANQPELSSRIPCLRSSGVHSVLFRDTGGLTSGLDIGVAGFDCVQEIERQDASGVGTLFDAAQAWLEREAANGPYLLFLDVHGAHPPWFAVEAEELQDGEDATLIAEDSADSDLDFAGEPPRDTAEDFGPDWTAYLDCVAYLDQQLGAFLDFLRFRDEWSQSLIVVTSDTGIAMEKEAAGRPALRESLTHIPLLIRVPGINDWPRRSAALVQPVDIMPTILESQQVSIPPDVDGQSLIPLIRFGRTKVLDCARLSMPGLEVALRTPAWLLIKSVPSAGSEMPSSRLFAKPEDRWERDDVARQFQQVVEDLESSL